MSTDDTLIFTAILSADDIHLLTEQLEYAAEFFIARGVGENATGYADNAEASRLKAVQLATLAQKLKRSQITGKNITLDDLIFYSVSSQPRRNRSEHVSWIHQYQFFTDDHISAYGIENRIKELTNSGDLIVAMKNRYAGNRYQLGENKRSEQVTRIAETFRAWREYRLSYVREPSA